MNGHSAISRWRMVGAWDLRRGVTWIPVIECLEGALRGSHRRETSIACFSYPSVGTLTTPSLSRGISERRCAARADRDLQKAPMPPPFATSEWTARVTYLYYVRKTIAYDYGGWDTFRALITIVLKREMTFNVVRRRGSDRFGLFNKNCRSGEVG
jgi:hypothetical protein